VKTDFWAPWSSANLTARHYFQYHYNPDSPATIHGETCDVAFSRKPCPVCLSPEKIADQFAKAIALDQRCLHRIYPFCGQQ
jgi:hypothetical protein